MSTIALDERYLEDDCLLPEIRAVGHVWKNHPSPNTLEPHAHPGAFEICYIVDGIAEYWTESASYRMRAGQLFVTMPDELHGGVNATSNPGEIYWIQVAIRDDHPFAGLTLPETKALQNRLQTLENRVFDARFDLSALFERILSCLRKDQDFRQLSLRVVTVELLLQVLANAAVADRDLPRRNGRSAHPVAIARAWIDEHLTEEFTTADAAKACGVSDSYLRKLFSSSIGRSPSEYRAAARIDRAKRLIDETDLSLTRIGTDLGFSSSQYFATVFKSYTGMTPRTFRRLSRSQNLPYRFAHENRPTGLL